MCFRDGGRGEGGGGREGGCPGLQQCRCPRLAHPSPHPCRQEWGHPGWRPSSGASPGPGWRVRGWGPGLGPPSLGVSVRQEASAFIVASFSKSLTPQCVSGTSNESTQVWLGPRRAFFRRLSSDAQEVLAGTGLEALRPPKAQQRVLG